MKVTRRTHDQLIIANTPWVLGTALVLFSVVFFGVGVFAATDGVWQGGLIGLLGGAMGCIAFGAFVRRTQLILDRSKNCITLRQRSVFGYREVQHALTDLSRAALETSHGSKGKTLRRPVLILTKGMSAGHHPILLSYTNGEGPRRAVDAINDWLADTQLDSSSRTP